MNYGLKSRNREYVCLYYIFIYKDIRKPVDISYKDANIKAVP